MQSELRYILETLAQGRHPERKDVEPIVKIFPKPAFLDELDHVAIGSRDQAEIDLYRFFRADRIDLACLQGAQQLDLRIQGQLANLVDEQGAAVGLLKRADPLVDRARKGTPLVAE